MIKFIALSVVSMITLQLYALDAVPGEFIVKLRPGVTPKQFFTNNRVSSVFPKSKRLKANRGQTYLVKASTNVSLSTVKRFRTHPAIEYIEPNYLFHIPKHKVGSVVGKLPEDKLYSKLWGLNNDKDTDINAPEAWTISSGSEDIIVAVTDTGIDYTHPDLKPNMWVNEAEKNGKPGVDDDGNGYVDDIHGYDAVHRDGDPLDKNSHGSHCSGTIAAAHNQIGVAGVAAKAKLMAVQLCNQRGSCPASAIIEALTYAAKSGAHVVSASWGGGRKSQAVKDIIAEMAEKGMIFVAAAGNASSDNDRWNNYPSGYDLPNIVAVGSYEESGSRSSFSNYGKTQVDVFAPGSNILSTIPGEKYASYSGTSMATPHVTGMVAVLLSLNPKWLGQKGENKNLKVNPEVIKNLLVSTSTQTKELKGFSVSNGRMNFQQLLEKTRELLSR